MTHTNLPLAAVAAFLLLLPQAASASDPWADTVVAFSQGTVANPGFADPSSALGKPTRFTSPSSPFGGVTTPLNGAFGQDELFSVGVGGSITVAFDEPVTDHPSNPFGIDLLVFGNAFLSGSSFFPPPDFNFNPNGTVDSVFGEPGRIEVSADNVTYVEVPGVFADDLFPTNGYADITEPFTATPGSVPSDFTKPVDPGLDVNGLTFAQVIAAYDGSGGGAGIDLASVGLSSISYVRITNPGSDPFVSPEIDAFADVRAIPEPSALLLTASSVLVLLARRRSC